MLKHLVDYRNYDSTNLRSGHSDKILFRTCIFAYRQLRPFMGALGLMNDYGNIIKGDYNIPIVGRKTMLYPFDLITQWTVDFISDHKQLQCCVYH